MKNINTDTNRIIGFTVKGDVVVQNPPKGKVLIEVSKLNFSPVRHHDLLQRLLMQLT